uniref:Nucleolin 2-like n=1 Tax=Saccoglossus kowalevskii TaxID=10224 RepID=A0ABM0MQR3_SACKO|nr:PREDICTED: nucleolin 2-like [Saccoglossus kowalevskii]
MADVEASNDSESETDEDIAGERSAVGIKTKNEKKTPKKTAVVTPNSAKKSITSEMADVASASDNESETDDDIADERSAVGIKSKGEKITPKKTTIVTPNSAKKSITSETAYVASESDSESESDEDMNDEDTAVSITRKVEKKTPKKSTVGGVTQNSAKKLITSKILEVASSSDSENESDEDIADEEPAASITTEVEKKTSQKGLCRCSYSKS